MNDIIRAMKRKIKKLERKRLLMPEPWTQLDVEIDRAKRDLERAVWWDYYVAVKQSKKALKGKR